MADKDLELTRRKILAGAGAVGAAGVGAGLGTGALFTDNEAITNNSLTAGTLNMSVAAEIVAANDYWENQGIIGEMEVADGDPVVGLQASDVKPGDWVIICFTIDIIGNPACVTISTDEFTNYENGQTEPEADVDGTAGGSLGMPLDGEGNGELQDELLAEIYHGFTDDGSDDPRDMLDTPDETASPGTTLAGADDTYSTGVTVGGGTAFTGPQKFYLLLELPTEVGNSVQSDAVEFDLEFDAVQARNNDSCSLTGDEPDDCNCPSPSFPSDSTGTAEFANLLSVGPDPSSGYPAIDARVRVDTSDGNTAGDLGPSNFAINETIPGEGTCGQTIEDVVFESGGQVDIVVVFDDTGSMGGEISTLKSEVSTLTSDIESAGVDARYALVSFKDTVQLDTDFTDASTFQSAVSGLSASGGGDTPEDNVDALAVGTGNFTADSPSGASLSSFRAGAQRVVIDITDVGAYDSSTDSRANFTQAEIEAFLNDGNFSYFAVAPSSVSSTVSKRDIANNVDDGTWIDIFGPDFDTILTNIKSSITEPAYTISYTSSCPVADGSSRTVEVEVDDPDEGVDYEESGYMAPS